jgi:hypothetical protein
MTQFTLDTAPTEYAKGGGIRFANRRLGIPDRPPVVFFQHFMGTLDDHDPALSDALAAQRAALAAYGAAKDPRDDLSGTE